MRKLRKIWSLVAFSLLLGTGISARADYTKTDLERMSGTKLFDVLVDEVSPWVQTLSRDVVVYHYDMEDVSTNDPNTKTPYIRPDSKEGPRIINTSIQNSLWDPSVPTFAGDSYFGSGIYASHNPFDSISFGGGGNFWRLYTIRLSKGSKIMQVLNTPFPVFPVPLQQELERRYGCKITNTSNIASELVLKNKGPDGECREIVRLLIDKFEIAAMAYPWGWIESKLKKEPLCPGMEYSAFYLTSRKPFTPDAIRVYNKMLPTNGPDGGESERAILNSFFARFQVALPWKELPADPKQPELITRIQKETYNCGSFAEDFPAGKAKLAIEDGKAGVEKYTKEIQLVTDDINAQLADAPVKDLLKWIGDLDPLDGSWWNFPQVCKNYVSQNYTVTVKASSLALITKGMPGWNVNSVRDMAVDKICAKINEEITAKAKVFDATLSARAKMIFSEMKKRDLTWLREIITDNYFWAKGAAKREFLTLLPELKAIDPELLNGYLRKDRLKIFNILLDRMVLVIIEERKKEKDALVSIRDKFYASFKKSYPDMDAKNVEWHRRWTCKETFFNEISTEASAIFSEFSEPALWTKSALYHEWAYNYCIDR